jgi:hypothetical protein
LCVVLTPALVEDRVHDDARVRVVPLLRAMPASVIGCRATA